MKILNKYSIGVLLCVFTFGMTSAVKAATTTVNLGTTSNFAVLGSTTVTNTGSTVINGDLGLSPGTAVTGFPPGVVNGAQHVTDGVASQAQTDLITAYNDAAGKTPFTTVPTELGGTTKTDGVYTSADGTFELTGTLTLDAQGDPSAVFVFLTDSTLITGGSSVVSLTNGAQACNVFWKVGSSATLGTDSTFKGSIMAMESITLTTGAIVEGRVLAREGAVTLDTNTITSTVCAAVTTPDDEDTDDVVVVNDGDSLVDTGGDSSIWSNIPWNIAILVLAGISTVSLLLVYVQRRKEA